MLMSKGQWKDFFIEIKKSMNRYLSILFMVALGTAFFAGLRSSEPDMKESLDRYMDQTGYMNIRVLSTLGMTEEDVMAIGAVKGVTDAEGMYSVDVLSDLGDEARVIHVQSITGDINQLQLESGRLPEAPDECVADAALCDMFGLNLGDRITVYSGTDARLEDSLADDTFIITGIGISPDYLTFDRGSAAIGSGSITGFIAVDKAAFTAPAYSQVYVRAEFLDEYNCFSDEYAEGVEQLTERIEAIAGERCEIRYAQVAGEPMQEIADARAELEAARAEAEEQFAEAWAQITEGQETIQSGWEELDSYLEQLESGKADYESGTKTYYDSLAQVEDGERQIAEAIALLDEKDAELNAGRAALAAGWEQYNAGLAELEAAKAQIDEGEAQLGQLNGIVSAAQAVYQAALDNWEAEKAEHTAAQAALDAEKTASEEAGTPWQEVPELVLRQTALDVEAETVNRLETDLGPLKTAVDEAFAEFDAARQELEEGKAQYAAGMAELETAKQQLDSSQAQIDSGAGAIYAARQELAAKEQELAAARAALAGGAQELEDAKEQIEDSEVQIEEGRTELEKGEAELLDSIGEYEKAKADAEKEFADAEAELADAEAQIAEIEYPEWYVLDRNTVQNYVEYDLDAQKIGGLANVFPLMFFFVAALVSLTTMTRMVEEQRTQIGTLKALGYSDSSIAMKYILYALSATVMGSVLGVLIGSVLFPWVIINAYGMLYVHMPVVLTPIRPLTALLSAAIAIISTVGATWMACHHALTSHPAALMRPVAPTKGKRIFLEYAPFIWRHLNFSVKSTLRNLFRYKKRLFMTLFGIGACMGLLLVGFGLQDSLHMIIDRQYSSIWAYDMAIYLKDAGDEASMEALGQYLDENELVADWMDISSVSVEAEANEVRKDITIMVPTDAQQMEDFVKLHNRLSGEEYALDDSTAIISEKLSTQLSIEVGDTFVIMEDEASQHEVTVGAIVENYLQYYVYMSSEAYEKAFGEAPEWNQRLVLYTAGDDIASADEDALAAELLQMDGVTSLVSSASMRSTIRNMLQALDYVVLVLIVSAGLLAFVVLYNLNNINITERKRELATIKLLGFYPGELAAYVYRENVILTFLGIGAGVLMGTWLTNYVITTVEIDMLMFGRGIELSSYIICSLITVMFSVIVNLVMYYRLQKIDMIESLKSVE
ncbi:MAG: ABC transporter permease [Lachnospiraceae bacterium]|nr:ABC transporter permease [Lachnospiraceae bacterium]